MCSTSNGVCVGEGESLHHGDDSVALLWAGGKDAGRFGGPKAIGASRAVMRWARVNRSVSAGSSNQAAIHAGANGRRRPDCAQCTVRPSRRGDVRGAALLQVVGDEPLAQFVDVPRLQEVPRSKLLLKRGFGELVIGLGGLLTDRIGGGRGLLADSRTDRFRLVAHCCASGFGLLAQRGASGLDLLAYFSPAEMVVLTSCFTTSR